MFEQLRIKNFKAWQDTGLIQMRPLTLFFGTNSSGKSSIGHFLMMLKQTMESSDRKVVFYPGEKNSAIQLGSYKEMVFHRDVDNQIHFEYIWVSQDKIRFKDSETGKIYEGNKMAFESRTGMHYKEQQSVVVEQFKYKLMNNDNDTVMSVGMKRDSIPKSGYKVESKEYILVRKQGRAWSVNAPIQFYGFPDEVVAYFKNADFVRELNLLNEKLFRTVFYLGPLRNRAERLYIWGGNEPDSVGYSGESTVPAILAARNRRISLGKYQRLKAFEETVAQSLKQLGLIDEFRVNPILEERQEYEVKVKVKGSNDWVDLPDVGFGVSQVLPVVVQCYYAPEDSVIIMEQPEIHLHPSAQSALADIMIDVIRSRENGKDRNIQLIIETHSEHFLRRLQRRMAEDETLGDLVAAYFANASKTPVKLEALDVDSYGNIRNWPDNFFGDDMEDITAQAKAGLQRKVRRMDQKVDTDE